MATSRTRRRMTPEELLTTIAQAAREGWERLDLSDRGITDFPDEIGQLGNLRKLDLGANQLKSVPESIGQLANLQTLDLYGNDLTELPESIGLRSEFQAAPIVGNGTPRLLCLDEPIGQACAPGRGVPTIECCPIEDGLYCRIVPAPQGRR